MFIPDHGFNTAITLCISRPTAVTNPRANLVGIRVEDRFIQERLWTDCDFDTTSYPCDTLKLIGTSSGTQGQAETRTALKREPLPSASAKDLPT